MACALLIACCMNPSFTVLTLKSNFLRASFGMTLFELQKASQNQLTELRIPSSVHVGDHIDDVTRDLSRISNIAVLDFSYIPLSMQACRNICHYMVNARKLRHLDVTGCKLSYQGTRYMVDGLNRNQGLQFFNFALNDMTSSVYEFSIKVAKILTRHQHLMHLDLTNTGLKKEEVVFIGMALTTSKSCISLHLSANNLDYYERLFLRTLVNARVAYHFRNVAAQVGGAKS